MIIDVLQNIKIKIDGEKHFTIYDTTFSKQIDKVENNIIDFEFYEPVLFKNLQYDFTANTSPIIKLYYTYDMVNFVEFNYISYTIVDEQTIPFDIVEKIKLYEGRLLSLVPINSNGVIKYTCFIYDENLKVDLLYYDDFDILRDFILQQYETRQSINIQYVYEFKETNLYSNTIKGIRIELVNLSLPFKFNYCKVNAEVTLTEFEQSLSLLTDSYYLPKYFQENTFIPSITKTFFELLEEYKYVDLSQFDFEFSDNISLNDDTAKLKVQASLEDIFPNGVRYDGSINYDNAQELYLNGELIFDGTEQFDAYGAGIIFYNNEWDINTCKITMRPLQDENLANFLYNALISYDGIQTYAAKDSIEQIINSSIYRHYLYNGRKTYGSDKSYDGDWGYNGSLTYAGESIYNGIHEIYDTYLPPPDCSISGDGVIIDDSLDTIVKLTNVDSNVVEFRYDGGFNYDESITYYNVSEKTLYDSRLIVNVTNYYLYNGRLNYDSSGYYNGFR